MWVPNTDPSGSGLIADVRYRGQEGAADEAPMHSHLGILGVTGFLMRDVAANPLDYREGGPLDARRQEISRSLDSTNPDLRPFAARGGKMIVTIGTSDTLASPGAQLDYYQSLLDTMGRAAVDNFARLFVIPQAHPRSDRHRPRCRWRREDDSDTRDRERLRAIRVSRQPGRARPGAGQGADCRGGRAVHAALLVSAVPEVRERPAGGGRLVHLRAVTSLGQN